MSYIALMSNFTVQLYLGIFSLVLFFQVYRV